MCRAFEGVESLSCSPQDELRHKECWNALFQGQKRALRNSLLAFLRDLMDYRSSPFVQDRLGYRPPTATSLFSSDLYFPQQPQDFEYLNHFVTPSGRKVLEVMTELYGSNPNLLGICTSHKLAPLLKNLFSISNKDFQTKEFNSFYKSFTKSAAVHLAKSFHSDFCTSAEVKKAKKELTAAAKRTTTEEKAGKAKSCGAAQAKGKGCGVSHAALDTSQVLKDIKQLQIRPSSQDGKKANCDKKNKKSKN